MLAKISPLLLFAIAVIASAQTRDRDFVLDASKPYVYLQFDHIGPRKPIQAGEPSMGLWLRIVNNCVVPIRIGTFSLPTGEVGIGVLDEVVPEAGGGVRIAADDGAVPIEPILPQGGTDKPRPTPKAIIPEGYSAEVHSTTTIAPGGSILFSAPSNHVGPAWFMRIRFTLAVSRPEVGGGPYSYLDFFEGQIPNPKP